MESTTNRREFLKETALIGAAAAAMRMTCPADAAETAKDQMPKIKLGNLEVSRLILGSNQFFGFDHGNPQATGKQMQDWFTNERIMALLDEAAEHGVTAVWTPCYERWVEVWNEYREKGGKLANWIGQPDRSPMEKDIMIAVKNGATAICIQGCQIDGQVGQGKWDVIRGWLELIRSHGLPAGMATHGANTHLEAEERNLPADFYNQTMYRPDNYIKEGLEESLAVIEKLDKPVVGYKVLGAGRIMPKDTLPYVFKRMRRKDGICLGMFPTKDDPDQVAENATLTRKLTATG